jgi:hypothetical protein
MYKSKKEYLGFSREVLQKVNIFEDGKRVHPDYYDFLDDNIQAYVLSHNGLEVKRTPVQAKRLPIPYFRLASHPEVDKSDPYFTDGLLETIKGEALESIRRQEDAKLLTLLHVAIENHGQSESNITPNHVIERFGPLTLEHIKEADKLLASHGLPLKSIIINPIDVVDQGYYYSYNFTSFYISDVCPQGTTYLLADPKLAGRTTILYEDAVEHSNPEMFKVGFVIDEMISMMLLNDASVVAIREVVTLTDGEN